VSIAVIVSNFDPVKSGNGADNGKIKPDQIVSNDFEMPFEKVVRKYVRRWIMEKDIAEQIDFLSLEQGILFYGN
jgi:hypothetical protein